MNHLMIIIKGNLANRVPVDEEKNMDYVIDDTPNPHVLIYHIYRYAYVYRRRNRSFNIINYTRFNSVSVLLR